MTSIVLKPWGSYEVLEKASNYLIKRLIITPGSILSLQSHLYRSEHWIVVEGVAEVTIDNKITNLKLNKSIFIPKQSKHRVANKGYHNLIIIEIWYGDKLDEKDIVRYEDIYNRI
tara:strand:+ start:566 stop:910 length:345 start_codon:yes stop_codon:yes gene_type:complete